MLRCLVEVPGIQIDIRSKVDYMYISSVHIGQNILYSIAI